MPCSCEWPWTRHGHLHNALAFSRCHEMLSKCKSVVDRVEIEGSDVELYLLHGLKYLRLECSCILNGWNNLAHGR